MADERRRGFALQEEQMRQMFERRRDARPPIRAPRCLSTEQINESTNFHPHTQIGEGLNAGDGSAAEKNPVGTTLAV